MAKWKCPQCGKTNSKDDTTCLHCGYDVPLREDGTAIWPKPQRYAFPPHKRTTPVTSKSIKEV